MKTIVIKTQAELDALPDSFEEHTEIEIRSSRTIHVRINYGNASVVARNSSTVAAYDSSTVTAYGSSTVTAYDSSRVEAHNSSRVRAYDSSTVTAYDSSRVTAYNSITVTAYGSSTVAAYSSSTVAAYDSSTVTAYGSSTVTAYDSSRVEAHNSSTVTAYDSSTVRAYDSSTVTAYGSSTVTAHNSSRVEAHNSSRVEAYDSSRVTAYGSSTVTAYSSSRVDVFVSAYVLVLSSGVLIRKLLDYSTAIFRGCPVRVEEKADTAHAREVPRDIEVSFEEWIRRGVVYADGIYKNLVSQKKINDIEVFECEDFPKKTTSYVVKRGDTFSHGKTVEEAIEDLRYKISERDTSRFESWKSNLDQSISLDDAIAAYRTVTGACAMGVKEFVESIQVPETLTPKVVLEVTKDKYGHNKFRNFLLKKEEITNE